MAALLGDGPFVHVIAEGDAFEVRGSPTHVLGRQSAGQSEPGSAQWRWNGSALSVTNCRYGLRPLYYFVKSNEICVSTSVPRLLHEGAPLDFDEPALALFLRIGFFMGDDTAFLAIRAIPPDVEFSWSRTGLQISSRRPEVKRREVSRDDAIDELIALFQDSVARGPAPRSPVVLPLSGGRDSRHILLALLETGRRPDICLTARHFPPRANEDERIARLLCQEFELRHVVIDQGPSRIKCEIKKNWLTGFCAIEHAWTLCVADWLQDNAAMTYDGLGGDSLVGAVQQDAMRAALASQRDVAGWADNLLDYYSQAAREAALEHVLADGWYRRLGRDLARERLSRELETHLGMPEPLTSFHFWSRVRRCISLYSFQILPGDVDVLCPFLDDRLFDHMMSLPVAMMVDRTFHTEAIRRAYPAAKHIPFEDKSAAGERQRAYGRRIGRDLAIYLAGHGRSDFVKRGYVLPRLIRYAIDGDERAVDWFSPLVVLYLLQLESAARTGADAIDQGSAFGRA